MIFLKLFEITNQKKFSNFKKIDIGIVIEYSLIKSKEIELKGRERERLETKQVVDIFLLNSYHQRHNRSIVGVWGAVREDDPGELEQVYVGM